jgi:L-seryl-tRNA(Ser) seleniumtransferase
MDRVYDRYGVPVVINCVGYATRVGGSCPAASVLEAMRQANQAYVEIDDLQAAASRLIARCTGAEAGVVTCGAAAGLTLAAAACLAGSDPNRMDRLPDASEFPRNEIVYPQVSRFQYEHAVRASGARLVELDYEAEDALDRIQAAVGPRTAALGYAWHRAGQRVTVEQLVSLARRHGLPLIVDAAMALPPPENLRRFVEQGADLVTFSGGKHIQGPQPSGILCGREVLVRSAWLQMVDMDVRAGTWSLRYWVQRGWVERPPRHGIGRSMKVGKEAIIGLMVALEAYQQRDHEAEIRAWRALADEIHAGLAALPGLQARLLFPGPTGQAYAVVQVEIDSSVPDLNLAQLLRRLRERRPKVLLAEDERDPGRAYIYPMCLRPEDPPRIIAAFRDALKQ